MGRLMKVLVILVVAVLAVSYTVYALDYKGNYNVTVTYTAQKDLDGTFGVYGFEMSAEPTEVWDFWDIFRGHHTAPDVGYQVLSTISLDGEVIDSATDAFYLQPGDSITRTGTLMNVPVGEVQVRLVITDVETDTVVYDKTLTELIP